jgi:hypothetical protein
MEQLITKQVRTIFQEYNNYCAHRMYTADMSESDHFVLRQIGRHLAR